MWLVLIINCFEPRLTVCVSFIRISWFVMLVYFSLFITLPDSLLTAPLYNSCRNYKKEGHWDISDAWVDQFKPDNKQISTKAFMAFKKAYIIYLFWLCWIHDDLKPFSSYNTNNNCEILFSDVMNFAHALSVISYSFLLYLCLLYAFCVIFNSAPTCIFSLQLH